MDKEIKDKTKNFIAKKDSCTKKLKNQLELH